jgi:ABC-type nitrate/sulfonate/bicarbonate transport system permease component
MATTSLPAVTAVPAVRNRARQIARLASTLALAVLGLALVVGAYALVASVSNPTKLPSVGSIVSALHSGWKSIPAVQYIYFKSIGIGNALEYSGENVIFGVAVGTAVGLPLGIIIAQIRFARLALSVPLMVLGTVPLLVLMPFITLWFGTARFAQSGLVIVFSLLTVCFATQSAAGVVGEAYTNYATSLGASSWRRLFTVVLPACMPNAIGAIRVALAAGWGLELVVETIGAKQGLGLVIQVTSQLDDTASLLAAVLAVAIFALIADGLVAGVGFGLTRWKE